MAFTATEKQDLRNYLGAPGVWPDLQHRLEGALNVIGENTESATRVREWMARLVEIDDALIMNAGTTAGFTYGTLKKADEVEFYPITKESSIATQATIGMQDQGRLLIARIARILGVWPDMPVGDYFSSGGRGRSTEMPLG